MPNKHVKVYSMPVANWEIKICHKERASKHRRAHREKAAGLCAGAEAGDPPPGSWKAARLYFPGCVFLHC